MVLHDDTWLTWDLVLCFADYGKSKATEKGVTLKAKQDERSIILRKSVSIFLRGRTLLYFLGLAWWYEVLLRCFPMTKAPSVFPVGKEYSVLKGLLRLRRVVCNVLWWRCYPSVANPNHFYIWLWSKFPRKRDTYYLSSEHSSIVTGKAWGFSVLLF